MITEKMIEDLIEAAEDLGYAKGNHNGFSSWWPSDEVQDAESDLFHMKIKILKHLTD